jgi:hypothetical protein
LQKPFAVPGVASKKSTPIGLTAVDLAKYAVRVEVGVVPGILDFKCYDTRSLLILNL